MTLGGVALPKGLILTPSWIPLFYKAEVFEDPFEFIPERWEKEEYKKQQQMVSMVFSGGPRNCIGKNLALTELKVMVIKFMKRYEKLEGPAVTEKEFKIEFNLQISNNEATVTKRQ